MNWFERCFLVLFISILVGAIGLFSYVVYDISHENIAWDQYKQKYHCSVIHQEKIEKNVLVGKILIPENFIRQVWRCDDSSIHIKDVLP